MRARMRNSESENIKGARMTIAILCPTRGRPEKIHRMLRSAQETSSSIIQALIASADIDSDIYMPTGIEKILVSAHTVPDNLPTAHKWNLLAEKCLQYDRIKLFMLGSDDMYFDTPGWDKSLLDHYNALENKIHVYALQDSRDPDGTPHPIVTREYIEALGYFVPPIFLHWFVDSWTVEIAKANGVFTHLKDYLLVHDKPSDKGVCDETHNRIRQWGWHERDKWVNEKCQHFLEHEKTRLCAAINGSDLLYVATRP